MKAVVKLLYTDSIVEREIEARAVLESEHGREEAHRQAIESRAAHLRGSDEGAAPDRALHSKNEKAPPTSLMNNYSVGLSNDNVYPGMPAP